MITEWAAKLLQLADFHLITTYKYKKEREKKDETKWSIKTKYSDN